MESTGYRLRCHLIGILIVGYLLGVAQRPQSGRSELYPFFSWSLFSYTHSMRNDIIVQLHQIDGNQLDNPVSYYDLPKKLTNFPGGKIRMRKMLFDLNSANVSKDEIRRAELIEKYENTYFRNMRSVRYKIVVIDYDPIKRLNNGEFELGWVVHEGRYEAK